MSCLEFRRAKLADPRRLPEEALAHASACPACTAFAREVDEGERALDRALQTQVPEGLAERIIFRSRTPRARWRAWTLAAGVLLALVVGILSFRGPADQYARLAIEHVVMEPESLTSLRNADPDMFRTVVHNFGASMKELPGPVRYIRLCPVEDGMGWHVVFETREGLATLILVPGKRLAAAQSAAGAGWSALARPAARGYYAIVTPSPAMTEQVDRLLRARVDWNV
jgi:Protein of unknown function (DUF3379)